MSSVLSIESQNVLVRKHLFAAVMLVIYGEFSLFIYMTLGVRRQATSLFFIYQTFLAGSL